MTITALNDREVILVEDDHDFILESSVISQEQSVYLDYDYESPLAAGSGRQNQSAGRFDKFILMRIIDLPTGVLRPLNQSSPPRGELEIVTFGRSHLLDIFKRDRQSLSLPFFLFIDGFGLYRNMYKSLMGIYAIPTNLTSHE